MWRTGRASEASHEKEKIETNLVAQQQDSLDASQTDSPFVPDQKESMSPPSTPLLCAVASKTPPRACFCRGSWPEAAALLQIRAELRSSSGRLAFMGPFGK